MKKGFLGATIDANILERFKTIYKDRGVSEKIEELMKNHLDELDGIPALKVERDRLIQQASILDLEIKKREEDAELSQVAKIEQMVIDQEPQGYYCHVCGKNKNITYCRTPIVICYTCGMRLEKEHIVNRPEDSLSELIIVDNEKFQACLCEKMKEEVAPEAEDRPNG